MRRRGAVGLLPDFGARYNRVRGSTPAACCGRGGNCGGPGISSDASLIVVKVRRARTHQTFRQAEGGTATITLEDCIALCGLTRQEVDAIAEHEHLPEAAAAALAAWLMGKEETGVSTVIEMLRDDIRAAISRGDHAHAVDLIAALRHFLSSHRAG